MTSRQASQWLDFFQRRFNVLVDREQLLGRWHTLVKTLDITGLKAHDVRLVAAMETYGITHILTFNSGDFTKLPINTLDPTSL